MPKVSDEAIVLKLVPQGESNLILHLLTKARGRRTVIARAARKSRKRFAGSLQPFSYIRTEMSIRRTQSMGYLDSAESIRSFFEVQESLSKIYLASYYCDLLDVLLVEGEQYPEAFALMLFFLNRLGSVEASVKHRLFFEIRLMDLLGYRPDSEFCGVDGTPLTGVANFDERQLVFISEEAAKFQTETIRVSQAAREVFVKVSNLQLADLGTVKLSKQDASDALAVTRALIITHAGRPLKSMTMLDEELKV